MLIVILLLIALLVLFNKKICRLYESFSNRRQIPKVIYQTYTSLDDVHPDILKCSRNKIQKLNPDYQYEFYSNNDIKKYIRDNWGEDMLSVYNSIDPSYGPARADLFRYMILYDRGGIYLDIKSSCKKKFDDVIGENDELILCNWGDITPWADHLSYEDGEFINWFIACKPKHPLMKQVIDNIVEKIKKTKKNRTVLRGKTDVLFLTGPVLFTKTLLPELVNYDNVKIYSDYRYIGLVYSCENHIKLFKNHYTKNFKPIINFE